MLQPDVLARGLKLDRKALEEKARRDNAKLKSMIDFCYVNDCRQAQILEYFGEANGTPCGTCDACRSHGAAPPRDGTAEEITMLRQALSGIARMSRRTPEGSWEGRFGKGRIVAMLTGSKSREVLDAGLDQLTTYGLLKNAGSNVVNQLFQEIERHGLVLTTTGEYPLLTLTAKGAEVMKTGAAPRMRWPEINAKASPLKDGGSVTAMELGFDEVLFEKMKKLRNALAQSEGKPAYVIFSNQTLEFLTRLKPTTVDAAKKIRGIGDAKATTYLPEFLQLIRNHAAR
jgi:ATP-dependent DNA helicase RecQ